MSGPYTIKHDGEGFVSSIDRNGRAVLQLIRGAVRNEDNAEKIVEMLNFVANDNSPLIPIPSGTEGRVVADIARRQLSGRAKYGTTIEANPLPLRSWLQHAYEEALDLAVYLRRAMEEMDKEVKS